MKENPLSREFLSGRPANRPQWLEEMLIISGHYLAVVYRGPCAKYQNGHEGSDRHRCHELGAEEP
jgi:hypothetical protein